MAKAESSETALGSVLFVDDEENILRSIRRIFFQSGIKIYTATRAREGLSILKVEKIDLVVSDYRMPEMDGFHFLKKVRDENPEVQRVILSGYVDQSVVLKALLTGLAVSYLTKPWDNEEFRAKVLCLLSKRGNIKNDKFIRLLNSIQKLPTLPSLYQTLLKAVETKRSMEEIADIIGKDPTVTTKLLQIANSSFYGSSQISSIKDALVRIGLSIVKEIVLTISIVNTEDWTKEAPVHLSRIFLHSTMVNRYLPQFFHLRCGAKPARSLQSVGITHDIGKILLLGYLPDRFEEIVRNTINHSGVGFYESEIDLGFDDCTHADIGGYFLDQWGLPEPMIEIALHHHSEEIASDNYRDALEAVKFTDKFVNQIWMARNNTDIDWNGLQCPQISNEDIRNIAGKMKDEMNQHAFMLRKGGG